VLFIAVDDLRPELRCYGNGQIVSPNIDRLASQGVMFSSAYSQVAVCGASRASVFTGVRPNRNRFTEASTRADVDAPDAITLPELFKNNGYYTVSNGKVFHAVNDSADSWSEAAWRPSGGHYQLQENIDIEAAYGKGPGYESADVADNAYKDGMLAEKAISDLGRLKDFEEPFFLAVGFFKPHLPFVAPKRYWDMYPEAAVKLPDNYSVPSGAPAAAIHTWGEMRSYHGMPASGPLSDDLARTMIRGYYSCTSYIDVQIGMILDELDALGLRDNTIVVLWYDHGWNLGEHTLWAKHCVFDTSLRVPLIISAPGYSQGERTASLVENVDLYPTLCELAGLDTPGGQLHGESLVPILSDPTVSLKTEVYGRWKDADAIRTDQYLYSQWVDDSGAEYARMMYDHYVDPNETVNISEEAGLQGLIDTFLTPKLDAIRLY
jgi:arylsulfatase A-like enzyme